MNNAIEILERAARKYPEREAYEDESKVVHYSEVWEAARSVGTGICRQVQAVRVPIVIYLDKSVNSILAFWGTVLAGSFYCPLDTEMPIERIQVIMGVLSPKMIITDSVHYDNAVSFAGAAAVLLLEDLLKTPVDDQLLAGIRNGVTELDPLYVLFTSGSTGVPKGVLLPHRVVTNYLAWLDKTFSYSCEDVFGNQAPLYFDISVHDIYGAAFFGAKMVIIPKYLFGFPAKLIEYMNDKKISTFLWVPSAMGIIAKLRAFRACMPKHLRHAMFAGEVFPRKQLDYWTQNLPDIVYANLYGPTETYVCTAYVRTGREPEGVPLSIGKPILNTEALILDDNGNPVSKGETGELCIRGCCLALGYYNNPERTAQSFVQNPTVTAYPDRIYHTGDLVYLDEEDNLIYVSRKDFQIKHMGYRIELGEIEAAAARIEGIADCACTYDTAKQRIILYYEGTAFDPASLTALLGKLVPEYMLPGRLVHMDALPHNANGKIDRKALSV